jgi:hypothetical protein
MKFFKKSDVLQHIKHQVFVLFYPPSMSICTIFSSILARMNYGLVCEFAEFGIGAACCCESVILVLMLWV